MSKRAFPEIRKKLLLTLRSGELTVNNLSKLSGVNWKTADNHLIYLIGKGFVKEVFVSSYVKIYALTEKGLEFIKKGGGKS